MLLLTQLEAMAEKSRVDDAIGHLRNCRLAFMAAKKEEVNATALQLLMTQTLHKTSGVFSPVRDFRDKCFGAFRVSLA